MSVCTDRHLHILCALTYMAVPCFFPDGFLVKLLNPQDSYDLGGKMKGSSSKPWRWLLATNRGL